VSDVGNPDRDGIFIRIIFIVASTTFQSEAVTGEALSRQGVNNMMKMPPGAGEELFKQINYPKDPDNMSDLEKKHWPRIECPDVVEANKPFDVTVNIGVGIDHPSELAHFIEWIDLNRGELGTVREYLQPKYSYPRVTFRIAIDKDTMLVARESCNLHGIWENKKQVTIK
jgi:superoxide reductase